MKIHLTLMFALGLAVSFLAPKKSDAAVGLVMMLGGPAGTPVALAGGKTIITSIASVYAIELARKVAPHKVNPDLSTLIGNILFWPGLFILDNQLQGLPKINANDLIDNGYDEITSAQIESDYRTLIQALEDSTKTIHISKSEANENLKQGLLDIALELKLSLSDEFIEVYSQRLALVAEGLN
ncbi:MAG: hypothetical protein AB7I27_05590 [Bacteriovoracaceae bacterium]